MNNKNKLPLRKLAIPFVFALCVASPARALTININDITDMGADPDAVAAFNAAAAMWESVLFDEVTVNIDFNFAPLGSGILGGTSIQTIGASVTNAVAALGADATSADDLIAVSNLPAGPTIGFRTNDSSGAVIFDNNSTGNNAFLDIGRAAAKAIGLVDAMDAAVDAAITFSSNFGFDLDPSDGIAAGLFDFVGVAAHEIGHALGFVSGVDVVDVFSDAGPGAPLDLDIFRVFSLLDLFRYSDESLALGAGVFDYATGPHAANPFFSIDGGATNLATFETGEFNGTGLQASHWEDSLGLGIMDPTFAPGETGVITALDLRAFDVMGWDLVPAEQEMQVPEPGTLALLGLALFTMALARRRLKT